MQQGTIRAKRCQHIMVETSESACCFTGHRIIPAERTEELRRRLRAGILYLHDNMGITTFYAGGALGFDSLAAEAVIAQREELKDIRLVIVIPCRDQAARWSAEQRARYERINRAADEVICLAERYHQGCMHERNRYMVDHSQACICYLTERTGSTTAPFGKPITPIAMWRSLQNC